MSELLLEITIKATLVILAAMAVMAIASGWSAAGRHLVWAAALAVTLVVPLAAAFGPRWGIGVGLAWPARPLSGAPGSVEDTARRRGAAGSGMAEQEVGRPGGGIDIDALFPRAPIVRRDEAP